MKEHKHAAVLRAIADGVPLSEFEAHWYGWADGEWDSLPVSAGWMTLPDEWEVRRKQQFITVNGFKVPKPVENVPPSYDYYMAEVRKGEPRFVELFNYFADLAKKHCATNTVHLTKEAAMAHAKAMLGIDPSV